jgi:formylglycine-generating enzyme required for sulfatase activity
VPIPAGEFDMGAPDGEVGRNAWDGPVHHVVLTQAFCLKATEVTQGEWSALIPTNPSAYSACGATCPVDQATWWEALTWCNALSAKEGLQPCYTLSGCTGTAGNYLACTGVGFAGLACPGYRLPTEAEWEYAARAGTTTPTYGGALDAGHLACEEPDPVLDALAWFCGNIDTSTSPVAGRQPNAWGAYDMLGNVWEWVWDLYGDYPAGTATDPLGATTGEWRVFRGGAWDAEARFSRAAGRYHDIPGDGTNDLGFRAVRSIVP